MLIKRLELLTSNLILQKEFYSLVLDLPAQLNNHSLHIQVSRRSYRFTTSFSS
jgi:hypothetical protein